MGSRLRTGNGLEVDRQGARECTGLQLLDSSTGWMPREHLHIYNTSYPWLMRVRRASRIWYFEPLLDSIACETKVRIGVEKTVTLSGLLS